MTLVPIKLPPLPRAKDYPSSFRFYHALSAWEETCRSIVQRSAGNVQPPPMPSSEDYEHTFQYYRAVAAWRAVFEE